MRKLREDADTARTIDVALVIKKLGKPDEACDYLRAARVAEDVIERVLSDGGARVGITAAPSVPSRDGDGAPGQEPGPGFYNTTGRRRDVTSAAMVQAALSILPKVDVARAERLLRREQVPDEVIARVLSGGASRRRARQEAPAAPPPVRQPGQD